jgi:hypothetical protein
MMINLDMALTYHSLQEKIKSELNIPPDRQKIRHGFPPRELAPPSEGKEYEPLLLQHGDKLSVEILPHAKSPQPLRQAQKEGNIPVQKEEGIVFVVLFKTFIVEYSRSPELTNGINCMPLFQVLWLIQRNP